MGWLRLVGRYWCCPVWRWRGICCVGCGVGDIDRLCCFCQWSNWLVDCWIVLVAGVFVWVCIAHLLGKATRRGWVYNNGEDRTAIAFIIIGLIVMWGGFCLLFVPWLGCWMCFGWVCHGRILGGWAGTKRQAVTQPPSCCVATCLNSWGAFFVFPAYSQTLFGRREFSR